MTPAQIAKRLRDIVGSAQGDDLERATNAFQNLTQEQLGEQHGQSGHTRREIWDGYKNRRADDIAVYEFLDELLTRRGL